MLANGVQVGPMRFQFSLGAEGLFFDAACLGLDVKWMPQLDGIVRAVEGYAGRERLGLGARHPGTWGGGSKGRTAIVRQYAESNTARTICIQRLRILGYKSVQRWRLLRRFLVHLYQFNIL